jgi:hypothetical protein
MTLETEGAEHFNMPHDLFSDCLIVKHLHRVRHATRSISWSIPDTMYAEPFVGVCNLLENEAELQWYLAGTTDPM